MLSTRPSLCNLSSRSYAHTTPGSQKLLAGVALTQLINVLFVECSITAGILFIVSAPCTRTRRGTQNDRIPARSELAHACTRWHCRLPPLPCHYAIHKPWRIYASSGDSSAFCSSSSPSCRSASSTPPPPAYYPLASDTVGCRPVRTSHAPTCTPAHMQYPHATCRNTVPSHIQMQHTHQGRHKS